MKLFEIQIKPIEGFEKYLNFRETFLKLFHFFNKHPTDNQLGKWWKPTFQKTLSAFLTSNFKALISVSLFLAVCNFQIKTSSSLHDPEKSFWIVEIFLRLSRKLIRSKVTDKSKLIISQGSVRTVDTTSALCRSKLRGPKSKNFC
jgi:hypothetical protein